MFKKLSITFSLQKENFLIYKDVWHKLRKKRKNQLKFLCFLIIINAFSEMISLGLVVPFLSVLLNQEILWENQIISRVFEILKVGREVNLALPITLIFISSSVFTALIRLWHLRLSTFLTQRIGNDLSCEAFYKTLDKPYEKHIETNSSDVIAVISNYIAQTIFAIDCVISFITSSLIALFLLLTIFIISPELSFNIIASIGCIYLFIAIYVSRRLDANGKLIANATNGQIRIMQESLGGIRDVILSNKREFYFDWFKKYDLTLRNSTAQNSFISSFPRYILESLALILIALFSYRLLLKGSAENVFPYLGMIALSGQKLLPTFQRIFQSWTGIKTQQVFLIKLVQILEQPTYKTKIKTNEFCFKNYLQFKNVNFQYSKQRKKTLHNINFKIYKGQRIGILGTTGSGKSTTVDILMGLLKPTSGQFLIDGLDIFNNKFVSIRSWRENIAHVPQNIFFSDATIAENIAFGLKKSFIDLNLVQLVSKEAQINRFIDSLPNKYQSIIGEGGSRLSGGQRQRLGIARALYLRKPVLILDEVTSALDSNTEASVINAINNLSKEITIFIISHKISTLDICDTVFQIEDGKLTTKN